MVVSINSNIASLKGQRSLTRATEALGNVYERLSSGQRINRASDDAAGLAIALSLQTTSRIYGQSIRNINDGISAVTIASSAIQSLSDITIRLRELATQGANGTYSTKQREVIDLEGQALRNEFNRVVATTSFNGVRLLDENTQAIRIEAGDTSLAAALFMNTSELEVAQKNTGTFQTRVSSSTGTNPRGITSADLNQDGYIDIITADETSNSVTVLIGNGDGTFKAKVTYATDAAPWSVAATDVNNDGILDLVSANNTAGSLSVLIGNSNGTFRSGYNISSAATTRSVIAGDLNEDGNIDLIAANFSGPTTVFLGNGNGSFKASLSMGGGSKARAVVLGDVNNDGNVDILTAFETTNNIAVALGNGDGTFKSVISYSTYTDPGAISLGDVNGDGQLDVVTADQTSANISILLGNTNGTFKVAVSYTAGAGARALVLKDLNSDGALDVATGDFSDSTISILFGNGNGTFFARSTIATGSSPGAILAEDFNEDGTLDIIAAERGVSTIGFYNGNGTGTSYLQEFDLSTVGGSLNGMRIFERVLGSLGQARGALGAVESRLSTAARTIQVTKDNYSAAHSRIMDVDVAESTSELIRNNILQQSASSILSQANQIPGLALTLLRS